MQKGVLTAAQCYLCVSAFQKHRDEHWALADQNPTGTNILRLYCPSQHSVACGSVSLLLPQT